jgi:hypothetical protein
MTRSACGIAAAGGGVFGNSFASSVSSVVKIFLRASVVKIGFPQVCYISLEVLPCED